MSSEVAALKRQALGLSTTEPCPGGPTTLISSDRLRKRLINVGGSGRTASPFATNSCATTFRWTFARYYGVKTPSPALFGATRIRSVPSIGLRGHRPWAALNGKGSKRGALLLVKGCHNLRNIALACAALPLVAGCATTHTRWVQTYCVTPDQYAKLKQAEPGKIGSQLDGNAQHDLKLIAGNDLELRTFSDGLLGVIGSCVDPNTEHAR